MNDVKRIEVQNPQSEGTEVKSRRVSERRYSDTHYGDKKIMKQRHYQQYLARKAKSEREESVRAGWEFAEMANCPIHECLVPQGLF